MLIRSNRGRSAVPIQDFVVRLQNGLWVIRHGEQLLSGHPTYLQALEAAEILAHAAVDRGERARILLGRLDNRPIEFPIIEPPNAAKEKAPPERGHEVAVPE
jgi:hypothetical protein